MTTTAVGWDHAETARAFRRFQQRATRYRDANRELVKHAALTPGQRVLDLGAGDGGTARAALPCLGPDDEVLCAEPADAMRASGRRSLSDPRVTWTDRWPAAERFDRILCGAAIWQILPLSETFRKARTLLRPGGCLCFDIPGALLGEADPPGGGRDPHLLELMAALHASVPDRPAWTPAHHVTGWVGPDGRVPDADYITDLLRHAGFRVECWHFVRRFGQDELREWLKIPPTTDGLLLGMAPEERVRRIDDAHAATDRSSWKWERWLGWTAWVPA